MENQWECHRISQDITPWNSLVNEGSSPAKMVYSDTTIGFDSFPYGSKMEHVQVCPISSPLNCQNQKKWRLRTWSWGCNQPSIIVTPTIIGGHIWERTMPWHPRKHPRKHPTRSHYIPTILDFCRPNSCNLVNEFRITRGYPLISTKLPTNIWWYWCWLGF